jgi:hypothetical protein
VSIEHGVENVYFCRCPHCVERFEQDPEALLARLAI